MKHVPLGYKQGSLTVNKRYHRQSFSKKPNAKRIWQVECSCDRCGNQAKIFSEVYFISRRPMTCGCYRNRPRHVPRATYNFSDKQQTRAYEAWYRLLKRVPHSEINSAWLLPNNTGFFNYLNDMGYAPPRHHLTRKDKSQPYSKNNCEWKLPTLPKKKPIKIGQRFYLLTVLEHTATQVKCRCICKREITTSPAMLQSGRIKHCGCRKPKTRRMKKAYRRD